MKTLHWTDIILPLVIIAGSWGAFPRPPAMFQRLSQIELFQYLIVFMLVYSIVFGRGAGGMQEIGAALMLTVGFYLVIKLLDLRSLVMNVQNVQQQ